MELNESEPTGRRVENVWMTSIPGAGGYPGKSLEETCLLSKRRPA